MRTTLAVISVVALCATASAQPAQPAPTAEGLYNEGQAAYDKQDFATAVARWQASYKASGESGLLFLLGQALRQNGQCKEALNAYRRFVALDPKSEQRSLADDFIRELGPVCGATPSVVAVAPTQTVPTEHRDRDAGRNERLGGIATAGAGVAMFAVGIGFGAHAQSLGDEVKRDCATMCSWTTEKSKDDAGHRDATVGRVLDVVGIAGIVGGVALYYLRMRGEVAVTPITAAHDNGAVITWSRSW